MKARSFSPIKFPADMDKTDTAWYNTDMNDVVFAGKYCEYKPRDGKFNKCLKVVCLGQGGYAVVPPYARFAVVGIDGGDDVVCIEQPLISGSVQAKTADDAACPGMRWAVGEAVRYSAAGKGGAALSALGQLIVAYAAEDCSGPLHPAVRTLKADLEKNFTDGAYSADGAIGKLPLNCDYVRKLFKKEVGATPHEFLNGLRMERAKAIIQSGISNNYSNYTVSQIAEACGFAEPLYFSRAFKKYFGVSPMKFINDSSRGG